MIHNVWNVYKFHLPDERGEYIWLESSVQLIKIS